MALQEISHDLVNTLKPLTFAPPTAYVYNPLEYAWDSHAEYLDRYGRGKKEVLLVGMNPGPFGMAQTGVPFGDVAMVRDWMGIEAPVRKPAIEHPKRPIEGFECPRSEVSGTRLWGWARDRFGTPGRFFERFFVANYCPLCFMEESGRNRTPDKLPKSEADPVFAACDEALRGIVAELQPVCVLGVGAFAEGRIREALSDGGHTIGRILHPSPASPAANRDWAGAAEKAMRGFGISLPDRNCANP
ncbi:MAG: single-stranded DNA-binding protein [Candidatus Hydrogenedentes bacterium]|nr:single-stranded DNA-binding protein [Candidatus Hydrogenedentota bacterium]